MITYERDGIRFNYRVAGICRHDGHVLIQRADTDEIWAMPGGRCELGEPSDVTIRRELAEEIGVVATIGRLLFVVENFFTLGGEDRHELCFYYDVSLPPDHQLHDKTHAHRGIAAAETDEQEDVALIFRWFPVDDLMDVPLYPTFLRTALRDVGPGTRHVVHWDEPKEAEPEG
jgi:ADP-ribose pyrophosphatase YjhB (NUDIX family)